MKRDFIQEERDQDLTMPPEFKGTMDNFLIPRITEATIGLDFCAIMTWWRLRHQRKVTGILCFVK